MIPFAKASIGHEPHKGDRRSAMTPRCRQPSQTYHGQKRRETTRPSCQHPRPMTLPDLLVSPPKDGHSTHSRLAPSPIPRSPSPTLRAPPPEPRTPPSRAPSPIYRSPSPSLSMSSLAPSRSPSPDPSRHSPDPTTPVTKPAPPTKPTTTTQPSTPPTTPKRQADSDSSPDPQSEVKVTEYTASPDSTWGLARNHSSLRLYLASRHNPFLESLSSPPSPKHSPPSPSPSPQAEAAADPPPQVDSSATPPPEKPKPSVAESGEKLLRRVRRHQVELIQLRTKKHWLLEEYAHWMERYEAEGGKGKGATEDMLWQRLWDLFRFIDGQVDHILIEERRAQRQKAAAEERERRRQSWESETLVKWTLLCVLLVWLGWRIGIEWR